MKVTTISVNSNGGMGGGHYSIYTKMSIDEIAEVVNSDKFLKVENIVTKRNYYVNPSWIDSFSEIYIEKSTDHFGDTFYYYGNTSTEAKRNALNRVPYNKI